MSQLTLESPTEGIKNGYVVKMSAALLLLMNYLCQMLDTACVSRVLLKNDCICMTKADGFRVLRREGGGGRVGGGGARDRLGLLDRHTGIVGSLPVRRADTLQDMLDIDADTLDEESEPDLGFIIPHMELVHR